MLTLMSSQAQKKDKNKDSIKTETISDSTEFIAIIDIKNAMALMEKDVESKMTLKEFKEIQQYFQNILAFANNRRSKKQ